MWEDIERPTKKEEQEEKLNKELEDKTSEGKQGVCAMPAIRCHNGASNCTTTDVGDGNGWHQETEAEENALMMGTVLAANMSDTSSAASPTAMSPATNWTEVFLTLNGGPTQSPTAAGGGGGGGFGAEVMIPLYSVIFLLSVVGNILVIVTLTQNRRMRTVTNVFLLNLVSGFLILSTNCSSRNWQSKINKNLWQTLVHLYCLMRASFVNYTEKIIYNPNVGLA